MHGVVIRYNEVRDSQSTNIYASEVADSVVEGNVTSGSRNSHGIYVTNGGSDNTIVRYNLTYGNGVNGIHFNGDASVGGDGLHTGLLVEGNIIHDNVANGIDADGVYDSTFVNNLIYANGRHGIRVFQIDASGGARNLVIANNTIADNAGSAIKLTQDAGGHRIFNNVLLGNAMAIVVSNTSFSADYNVVDSGSVLSFDGENSTMNLSTWQANGHGSHSVVSTRAAEFVDAANRDYHLISNALAVDFGTASLSGSSAPGSDINGVARPLGGAIDAGAYEDH